MPDDGNDGTFRDAIWRRFEGDEWTAFDALPTQVRRRMQEQSYDPWAVNALLVWRRYRTLYGATGRAERAMLRYLDHCERLERRAFGAAWQAATGDRFPHEAASASVLRYGPRADAGG